MKSTMFEDDVILVDDNIKVLEGELERWRELLKRNGLKTSEVKKEVLEFLFKYGIGRNESDCNIRLRKSTYWLQSKNI